MSNESKITEERLRRAGKLGAGLTKKEKYVLRFRFDLPLSDRAREIVEKMSHWSQSDLFRIGLKKIREAEAKAKAQAGK